jgi:hypothetical protein
LYCCVLYCCLCVLYCCFSVRNVVFVLCIVDLCFVLLTLCFVLLSLCFELLWFCFVLFSFYPDRPLLANFFCSWHALFSSSPNCPLFVHHKFLLFLARFVFFVPKLSSVRTSQISSFLGTLCFLRPQIVLCSYITNFFCSWHVLLCLCFVLFSLYLDHPLLANFFLLFLTLCIQRIILWISEINIFKTN